MTGIDKKISELPLFTGDLTNETLIPVTKDGITYKLPISIVRSLLNIPPTPDNVGYDVWINAGQSNAEGAASPIDTALDYLDPRIFQYAQSGSNANKVIIASDPLKSPSNPTISISAASHFARNLISILPSTKKIIMVPIAVGGTGLISGDSRWLPGSPGGDLYELAINATNTLLANTPGAIFRGFIWIQGETDANNSITQSAYATALNNLIAGFRTRITGGSTSILLIGSMVPSWIGSVTTRKAIDSAHREIPLTIERSWFVRGVYNLDNTASGFGIERIHYGTSGLREMGKRLFLDVDKASKNVLSAIPSVPTISLGNTPANSAWVSWTIPNGTYAYSYELSMSVNGGAYNVVATNLLRTDYKLIGLTLGSTYSFRVRSRLVGAFSGYSNIINYTVPITPSITPSTLPQAYFDIVANEGVISTGGKISFIADASTNGRHFYQKLTANQPSLTTVAGNPTIDTSPSQWLVGVEGSFPGNSSYTKLIVIQFKNFSSSGVMISSDNQTDAHVLWRNDTQKITNGHIAPFNSVIAPNNLTANVWYAIWVTYDVATGQTKIYQSDNLVVTGTTSTTSNRILSTYNSYEALNNGNNAYCLRFAMWNTVLSQAQIIAENTVMETNYGITLTN